MKLHPTQIRLLTALLQGLSTASKGGHSTLACLRHLFLTPTGTHVVLSATDLDLSIHWPLAGDLEKPVSCPLDWFLKMCRGIRPGGHLELKAEGAGLSAYPSTAPSARSPEPSISLAEMPAFTTEGYNRGGWLSYATLEKAVQSMPFISTDQTRYVLNGTFISRDGEVVATDGRRLAHSPTPLTLLPEDMILPVKLIKPLAALANGRIEGAEIHHEPADCRLPVWFNGTHLLAMHSGAYVQCRLIDGNYPNWRQVIPTDFTSIADLSAEFLAVLTATLARSPDKKQTTVRLDLADGKVNASIHCGSKDGSPELIDPVQAGTCILGGEPFVCAFNAAYLLDCLRFSGLRLRLTNEISPLCGGDSAHAETVLMPMRVNSPA